MLEKHKRQVILLAIACLFLLGTGVYAGIKIGQLQSSTGHKEEDQIAHEDGESVDVDPNAVDIDQAYLDSLNERAGILDEQSQANAQLMKYHLFTDVWFVAEKMEQELPIWNDPSNEHSMQVLIWLLEDLSSEYGERTAPALITTGAIAPGQMLRKVNLSRRLEAGTYPAVFEYTPVDRAGTKYSSFEARVLVHVQ
ncbi:MAG: hypothetical protein PHY12_04055 [Eubacteriales bacterium]|nr:hypothetical protein [Eubacteriales bacterium]